MTGVCEQTGKLQYDTRREAEAEIRPDRRANRAYECSLCGSWHLTSQPKAGGR